MAMHIQYYSMYNWEAINLFNSPTEHWSRESEENLFGYFSVNLKYYKHILRNLQRIRI